MAVYPLPRAICKILYNFCKIRGVKVISRFLNNEPRYLDPLLRAFIRWDAVPGDDAMETLSGDDSKRMTWEERYVLLSWLSHLLLAPFGLSAMSSDDIPIPYDNLGQLGDAPLETPAITKSLLSVALKYVNVPGKEREAATVLLARLTLRQDVQSHLLKRLIDWAFQTIQPTWSADLPSVYTCIGVLSFLARLGVSGQVENLASFVIPVFERTIRIAQEESDTSKAIRASAFARKTLIKILRTFALLAYSVNERPGGKISDDKLSCTLEDAIDHFLVSLADDDTPVRLAASKSLSIITLRLNPDMAAEVIEAVLASLEENILYEKPGGALLTPLEARKFGTGTLKRNLSAVDAQRWHGLLLTLAHLLFRRAPPTKQLPSVLQSLISGLVFEQRSSTGSSVGTGVRDASCFGIWALSRKYTTNELLALESSSIHLSTGPRKVNAVQMLAIELVCAACTDPSGNIRRGASAALQELVGRHPDTIVEGIPLVQVVDYYAVARRSRAMIDVAKSTTSLDHLYWSPLVDSLIQWRGIGSPDAASRRQAARAIGVLSAQGAHKTMKTTFQRLEQKLDNIPARDVETRHGCLLSIAATVEAYIALQDGNVSTTADNDSPIDASDVCRQIAGFWGFFDSSSGPTREDLTLQAARPELTAEASSRLICSLSQSANKLVGMPRPPTLALDVVLRVLSLCISRGEDIAIEPSSEALSNIFLLLSPSKREEVVHSLVSHIHATSKLPTGRGHILGLGAIFKRIDSGNSLKGLVVEELLCSAGRDELIEKRVVAVKCLSTEVLPHTGMPLKIFHIDMCLRNEFNNMPVVTDNLVEHFVGFLNDYTTDRRGDIGSLIRVEALQGAKVIIHSGLVIADHGKCVQKLVGCITRLAAEKLDKVRFQAWLCLQDFWTLQSGFPLLMRYAYV